VGEAVGRIAESRGDAWGAGKKKLTLGEGEKVLLKVLKGGGVWKAVTPGKTLGEE